MHPPRRTGVWNRASWAVVVCLSCVSLPSPCLAQGTRDDYERSAQLADRFRGKVFRATVEPHWYANGDRFWYRNDLPGGKREFITVNAVAGTRTPAFDAERLAAALSKVTRETVGANRPPFDQIAFGDSAGPLRFDAFGKHWSCDLGSYEVVEAADAGAAVPAPPTVRRGTRRGSRVRRREQAPSDKSPDGKWAVVLKDRNLFLREIATGAERLLGDERTSDEAFTGEAYWSPDSTHVVALRTRGGDSRKVTVVQSSPPDQLQPRLQSYDYLKPGDRIPITKPHLFEVASSKEVKIDDAIFPNPWSVEQVRWARDGARFSFLYNQRGHQVMRVVSVDAASGEARAIIDEQSKTFIDYEGKSFVETIDDTQEIIWMSERDGWCHLYLYDAATGRVKNAITAGEWVVQGVDRVDAEARQAWFRAGGIRPGQDPYYTHLCRVNFDGTGLVTLTEGDGAHEAAFSPDRRFLIDTWSRVDQPPVTELRSAADGKLLCELERADVTALLDAGWRAPDRFVAKARDGATDIYGVIYRPTHFDPALHYPVLEDIYAGPQGAFVPKAFAPFFRQQAMAELGFVVVQIDGMGTNGRSKAFHDVCWKNLADAGLPDRILWMKAAAARNPWMDTSRVGVYGTSAGGQSALGALLWHGDFYKAAVADCGCHDNRMDKIWWNELWMGWPVGKEYAENSNVTHAKQLQGKLLLIVGETDHNVDPASTMQVVNALIKADKDFDLLVIPNADHGQDGAYGNRRRQDFFVRNLLGVEPRRK